MPDLKVVHVYWFQIMQCHMLKVATGKLKLEHLVIEKGHFKQEKEPSKTVLQVSALNLFPWSFETT